MVKVSFKNYCDKKTEERESSYFKLCSRGKAAACSVAYPTKESRSDAACERVVGVSVDSFLRRPSLCDEAINTISGFINEGVYILQEPDKSFLCSSASLYVLRGRARWIVSGNARVYHFCGAGHVNVSRESREPLFGEKVRFKPEAEPEFDVSYGTDIFLLCSGADHIQIDELIKNIAPLDQETLNKSELDEWMDAVISGFHASACSAAVLAFTEQKHGLLGLFGNSVNAMRCPNE